MIEITDFDVAVIAGDTHIGQWVRTNRRLDIATDLIQRVKRPIRPGSIVIDGGANIGDHMMTYSHLVGEQGRVYAFECNPDALQCLYHNVKHMLDNWVIFPSALWETRGNQLSFSLDLNAGASHVTQGAGSDLVNTETIDHIMTVNFEQQQNPRPVSLIKLDIEGAELHALKGARETIKKYRPCLLLEVNRGALERLGSSAEELIQYVRGLNYNTERVDDPYKPLTDPQFDIFCTPIFKGATA